MAVCSCTKATTSVRTPGSVSGWTPCPRLKMWPGDHHCREAPPLHHRAQHSLPQVRALGQDCLGRQGQIPYVHAQTKFVFSSRDQEPVDPLRTSIREGGHIRCRSEFLGHRHGARSMCETPVSSAVQQRCRSHELKATPPMSRRVERRGHRG